MLGFSHKNKDENSGKLTESFLCYFDLGVNRASVQVSRQMRVPLGTVKLWASRYGWQERVRAYNTLLLQTRVDVATAARQQLARLWTDRTAAFKEREWTATDQLLALAQRVIDSFASRDPAGISLTEVTRALDLASRIGRLALGLVTDKQEITGPNGGPIQIEFEAALRKIYSQPLPGEIVDVDARPVHPPALTEGP